MEYFPQRSLPPIPQKIKSPELTDLLKLCRLSLQIFWNRVKTLGITEDMDEHESSKLSIFNQLNFFQLITGFIIPIVGFFHADKIPSQGWIMASLPAFISIAVLLQNKLYLHKAALFSYFIFYPVFLCVGYINGMNLGVELSFILYGILSVFFLQDFGFMIFSICLSMVSYFILSVVWKNYPYQVESINFVVYIVNQALAIIYIFLGLYLIKKENSNYQVKLLNKHRMLHRQNLEIESQKKLISEKAILLERQAEELKESNSIKNKLFSVISHDMRSPMYALRNLFVNAQKYKMPAKQIRELIPEVINDLNFTTGLMENLLHWAKCQMQTNAVRPQKIELTQLSAEVMQVLNLHAESKNISVVQKEQLPSFAWADKDMISLVIRNFLSNAIKYTPAGGRIEIGVQEYEEAVEVYVRDSGKGITKEEMIKILQNNFYTTNGTASETGTGLGLMLCKEFLAKNGGRMMIESEPGKGSTFSFTLPQMQ